jgi:hypothetical protein
MRGRPARNGGVGKKFKVYLNPVEQRVLRLLGSGSVSRGLKVLVRRVSGGAK